LSDIVFPELAAMVFIEDRLISADAFAVSAGLPGSICFGESTFCILAYERRRGGWMCSAIWGDPKRGLGILNNDMYRGVVVWNRARWLRSAADSGKRRQVMNPRTEWIEHKDESLRIVSDALSYRV
jgi:hypothetical protein